MSVFLVRPARCRFSIAVTRILFCVYFDFRSGSLFISWLAWLSVTFAATLLSVVMLVVDST